MNEIPPYSLEAEQSLVGCFIDDPSRFTTHRVSLSPDDFFTPGPRNIFRALCDIVDRGEVIRLETVGLAIEKVDFSTLTDAVAKCQRQESDFANDLKTVLGYSANRHRLAEMEAERTQLLTNPSFLVASKSHGWIEAMGLSVLTPIEIGKLDLPQRAPILGAWFLEGDLGFIYGPRGLGKTWLAMLIARAISDGKAIGPWKANGSRKVLYVDGEMAIDASLERAEQLAQGIEDNFLLLHHESLFALTGKVLNLTSPEAQAALTAACLAQSVRVLVLDNISCLFTLKENESDAWGERVLPWLLELRRHRIAVVFVHHSGRNGLMRGTSKREDAAFWSIKLSEAKSDHNREGASFVATFDKNRNATSEEAPSLFWHFEPRPDRSVIPKYETLTPMQVFISLIEDGLDSCGDIAQEMNTSKATVSRLAKKAQMAGQIVINGRNYELRK